MASNLGDIEKRLWSIADDLRANSGLKASEYSEPVLGLIFLRFASERLKKITADIQAENPKDYEITDDDVVARGAFLLPQFGRFDELLKLTESTDIGKVISDAMSEIEQKNTNLNNALPKSSYSRISTSNIITLLRALDSISFDIEGDIFGKIYEYFLGEFAMAEGQRGGQFFTPTSIVKLIVEIIEPFNGRIFDPACGSGGMFVQSARFIRNHQRNPEDDISIWGQEIMDETAHLCRMNLAVNGLTGNITIDNSLYGESHEHWGHFDFVMANPPFNVSGVDKTKIAGDSKRYTLGKLRADNANYLWIQMFYSSLNEHGRAGFVMANSASDARNSELDIRRQLLQKKAVDVMVSIGSNFFYSVTLPCTLWFLDKGKTSTPRENTVLFIDARNIYHQIDRAHRDFLPRDIKFIANIVRLYRGEDLDFTNGSDDLISPKFPSGSYLDILGLCKTATIKEIEAQGWSLNPGRYVGITEQAIDNFDFREKLEELNEELEMYNVEAHALETLISENMISLLEGREG